MENTSQKSTVLRHLLTNFSTSSLVSSNSEDLTLGLDSDNGSKVWVNGSWNNGTWENGTWSWWFPSLNLSGNRGGGVAHQNDAEDVLISTDDAAWVLTATFIIFTMQSGEDLTVFSQLQNFNSIQLNIKGGIWWALFSPL